MSPPDSGGDVTELIPDFLYPQDTSRHVGALIHLRWLKAQASSGQVGPEFRAAF